MPEISSSPVPEFIVCVGVWAAEVRGHLCFESFCRRSEPEDLTARAAQESLKQKTLIIQQKNIKHFDLFGVTWPAMNAWEPALGRSRTTAQLQEAVHYGLNRLWIYSWRMSFYLGRKPLTPRPEQDAIRLIRWVTVGLGGSEDQLLSRWTNGRNEEDEEKPTKQNPKKKKNRLHNGVF